MWQWGFKNQHLIVKTIKAKTHPETKKLFWLLFVGSRGSDTRIRIMSGLRKRPSNRNQLATELGIEYKAIQHHIKVLEGNNLVKKIGNHYGMIYYVSALFENSEAVFDEIVDRLQSINQHDLLHTKRKIVRQSMTDVPFSRRHHQKIS